MNARQPCMFIKIGRNCSTRMFSNRSIYLLPVIASVICVLASAKEASAAGPTGPAVLSNSSTSVGHPVQLQIKVTGSSSARPPGQIFVEGLDIRYSGQSQLLEGHNFQFSYSFIYNYTIMPMKAGRFK